MSRSSRNPITVSISLQYFKILQNSAFHCQTKLVSLDYTHV